MLLQRDKVLKIVAWSRTGSFGLLPNRRDCVAVLGAGILTYETEEEGEAFVAVDEGVLVKAGPQVLVSVRRAIPGADLASLRDQVEHEFMDLAEQEVEIRSVMVKLETGFLNRFASLRHE
ncbi:MAG: F0F1 ATP synthase subunit epsilon [Flavobacteriales bacterium]